MIIGHKVTLTAEQAWHLGQWVIPVLHITKLARTDVEIVNPVVIIELLSNVQSVDVIVSG